LHPKNPFAADYDFDVLARSYPALSNFVFINDYGTNTIKFADKHAVKALNSALLKAHYHIIWDIPDHHLCPPIPGRLDYLLYIADLIPQRNIHLLDIGTGANLIYPILATCHFQWLCTASEVDADALEHAQKLIDINSALQSIRLRHQKNKNIIFKDIIQQNDSFDVVVCNPPFYKNAQEAEKNNQRKITNLKLQEKDTKNFGGRSNELWYKGGEVAFIHKMAIESVLFKNQVHWFTSLISKKDNISSIKRAISKVDPTQLKVVDMSQGNKQSRFVAWTFR
jgi:23S rRNA (adenine1618-N6)-methyltransferase